MFLSAKSHEFLLFLTLYVFCLATKVTKKENHLLKDPSYIQNQGRITKGVEATAHEFPWTVKIREGGRQACSGSIINPHFFVTAAHCTEYEGIEETEVTAGDHNLRCWEGTETKHRVVDIRTHQEYDSVTLQNDIAVVQVDPPFQFNKYVSHAWIPQYEWDCDKGPATIIGWGRLIFETPLYPSRLRKVITPRQPDTTCEDKEPDYLPRRMNCIGQDGQASCGDDSGGPVLFSGRLCGVVSYGYECGAKGDPSVSTKVSYYYSWIMEHSDVDRPPLLRKYRLCGGYYKLPNASFVLAIVPKGTTCYYTIESLFTQKKFRINQIANFLPEDEIWFTTPANICEDCSPTKLQGNLNEELTLSNPSSIVIMAVRLSNKGIQRTLVIHFTSTGPRALRIPVKQLIPPLVNNSVIAHPDPDWGGDNQKLPYLNDDYVLAVLAPPYVGVVPSSVTVEFNYVDISDSGDPVKCPGDYLAFFLLVNGKYKEFRRTCGAMHVPQLLVISTGYALVKFQSTANSLFGKGFSFNYTVH